MSPPRHWLAWVVLVLAPLEGGWLAVAGLRAGWAWWGMVIRAVAGLWYLPSGALDSAAQIGLLPLAPRRQPGEGPA